MRHLSVIGLLLVVAVICPTVLAEDKASPAVKRILDKAVGKVRTNRAEFDKANKKPLDEARAELQELSTKLIKDGKTEEAGVVLKQVGTLEADVMRQANAPPPGADRAVPEKPLLERISGKWERVSRAEIFQLSKDGEATRFLAKDGREVATGRLTVATAEEAEIRWNVGFRWRMKMAGDDILAVVEWNERGELYGQGFVAQRIK